jgi:hypothetical protein
MTAESSQNKWGVNMLKIALRILIGLLLVAALLFISSRFVVIVDRLDRGSLTTLVGVLMMVIGVLVAALSSKKVSTASFNLSFILLVTLALGPIFLGMVLIIS